MKLSNLKRLVKEDFPQSDQDLIDRLAYIINPLLDQIEKAFNKNITTTDNLSREITTITINAVGGKPAPISQFKTGLSKVIGVNVISAVNTTNTGTYPTTAPFISWSNNANIITINNITGIQDNNKYTLTLEVIS